MSIVRDMFYRSFATQNSMVTFISKLGAREGQYQVKLGQKDKISGFIIFFQKHAYLVQFSIKISLNVIYIDVRLFEMPKTEFQKVTQYHLYLFFFFYN